MLTQEQFHDLRTYIPPSDTVKSIYANMHPEEDFDSWGEAIENMISKALSGDKDTLFNLFELIYLSGHNEGMLESASFEENGDG